MKVGIIGAGFGGLSAGYYLAKQGVDVTVFESDKSPGGLAIGFTQPNWKWSLEKHYHHWFTNDESIAELSREIGHKTTTIRPKTSTFIDGEIEQLDSPLTLLFFNKLPMSERIRTGMVLAFLKYTDNWKSLEKVTAETFIKKYMGTISWNTLWEPLFLGKFGKEAKNIPASWFWARIKKRTTSLSYPEGGFLSYALSLASAVKKYKGKIFYSTSVNSLEKRRESLMVTTQKKSYQFDRVIVTLPSFQFAKITKDLPKDYLTSLLDMKGVGAVNMVISLNQRFLEDGTYWLNINAKHFPFLAVVEHTNFMDSKNYGGEHLVYVGNYLPHEHEYFRMDEMGLLKEFYPYLKTINPKFNEKWVNKVYLFKAPFAQPIPLLNYSEKIPPFKTPIDNLYLCNMQQVYPWDRGTNYAVENGKKLAEMILKGK